MNYKILIICILFPFFLNFENSLSASTISGKIIDSDSLKLSFATVYVKNTTYGVAADFNGNYFMELTAGSYTLIYSYLGYENVEREIVIRAGQHLTINVTLPKSDVQINEIEVVADKEDKAKRILRLARDARKDYSEMVENFKCNSYIKTSIENEFIDLQIDSTERAENYGSYLQKEKLNLIEYLAEVYYKKPDKFKENILAYHNFIDEKPTQNYSITVEYGEDDIAPIQTEKYDPNIFYKNCTSGNFNFYNNLIYFPVLCNQPLVSPIAATSALNYNFEFEYSFFENNQKINKIKVTPNSPTDALFYGYIFIEDSTWALVSVELSINEKALTLYQDFKIIQNYQKIQDSVYLPVRTEINYTIKNNDNTILGNTRIINKDFLVNQDLSNIPFNSEIITYATDAFDKDTTYWTNNRLITLKTNELEFIAKTDSVQLYYLSDEFLDKQDSLFNRVTWWTPFFRIGHRNHYTGNEYWVGGLLEQVIPFGVGGYRHRLPLYFNKELDNGMYLETYLHVDYGFRNEDVKGKVGVGLTYYPLKFVRTFVEVGDFYEIINNYASLEQAFSRSNYARNKNFTIRQKMEVFNGFFAELSLYYSKQLPINNLELEAWSEFLFGELNEPVEFEPYTKSELKLELKYRIGQKYVIKKNRKIILGTDYPELSFTYLKGIPNFLNSEVNYDFLEVGAKDIMTLARFGESRWNVKAGVFVNKVDLRLLEYRYFRGSDRFFFSNPTLSMQLLDQTFSTSNSFLQANYIHHFNGTLLNKIPLARYTKITLAGGAGMLFIPDQDFYHFEMFGGFERIFKIKRELIRLGIYGVTADNTLSKSDVTFKVGLNFFNSYLNKWDY